MLKLYYKFNFATEPSNLQQTGPFVELLFNKIIFPFPIPHCNNRKSIFIGFFVIICMNQKQWIQFWKKAMKLDYDPNVKVQMIRPKNKYKSDIQSAIDETAKYPVKDT
ncbi:protein rep, partial [Staphylococcus aureus]|uniref:protein rep n=1 Tax=Staphylococcus aureus TaxID=1280 RepID=UPI00322221AC